MDSKDKPVRILTEEECWQRLAQHHVGRIVTHVGEVIDIVPINYAVDGAHIVFRTAAGTKLSEIVVNPHVVFEVDEFDDKYGWSVVVHGRATRIEKSDEQAEAERLPLKPLIATLKMEFVRITVDTIKGRAFKFGEEPNREAFQEG